MEQMGNEPPVHEGEKFLGLLGLGHLAERKITTADGIRPAKDFLEICGEHARPLLVGFEAMSPDDPRYEPTKKALQGFIGQYIEGVNPN
jgi:hypothetical protein